MISLDEDAIEDSIISHPKLLFFDQMFEESSGKHFSKDVSRMILEVTASCSEGRKNVNWTKVSEIFLFDESHAGLLKKIQNHYYNCRCRETRKETKKTAIRMKLLGLDL
jgi:hypothetical protein